MQVPTFRSDAFLAVVSFALASPVHAANGPAGNPRIWENPPGVKVAENPAPMESFATTSDPGTWGNWIAGYGSSCSPGFPRSVGQKFIAEHDNILRMDFRARITANAKVDDKPLQFRIYEWDTDYPTTKASTPLLSTLVDVSVLETAQEVISVYPWIEFVEDAEYYLEFGDPGAEDNQATRIPYTFRMKSENPYAGGELYRYNLSNFTCGLDSGADLWFKFFYATAADPPPALVASDTELEFAAPRASPGELDSDDLAALIRTRLVDSLPAAVAPERVLHSAFIYLACVEDPGCESASELLEQVQAEFEDALSPAPPTYASDVISYLVAYALLDEAPGDPLHALGSPFSAQDLEDIKQGLFDPVVANPASASQVYVTTVSTSFDFAAYYMLYDAVFGDLDQTNVDFYRDVWALFSRVQETQEDSSNYNTISLLDILLFGRFAEIAPGASQWYDDIWDPSGPFKKLVDRYYELVTPMGFLASYGDGIGIQTYGVASLIWMFFEAAEQYGDERYLETAERLLVYQDRYQWVPDTEGGPTHPVDDELTRSKSAVSLVMAYFLARASADSIPPQPSDPGSVYTLRRYVDQDTDLTPETNPKRFAMSEEPLEDLPVSLVAAEPNAHTAYYVPDKLILRSSGGADGLSFVFNLLQGYGHGKRELGALEVASNAGSLLMLGSPYPYWSYPAHPMMGSAPLLQRYTGGVLDFWKRGNFATLPVFRDGSKATVATLVWSGGNVVEGDLVENSGDAFGFQVKQSRHLIFGKNRFLLVRDAYESPPDGADGIEVSIGPVWHAQDVHPETPFIDDGLGDPNWLSIYHRKPLSNTTFYRNPEQYALVYMVERDGVEIQAYRDGSYLTLDAEGDDLHVTCAEDLAEGQNTLAYDPDCRNAPPYVIYQRWHGTLDATPTPEHRYFHTLILPHGPDDSPADAAARVTELAKGDDYVSLRLDFEDGESWIVVDNPNRRDVCLYQLEGGACYLGLPITDARYFVQRNAPGLDDYMLAAEASYVITPTYVALYGEDAEIEGEITDAIFTAGENSEGSQDGYIIGNSSHTAGETTSASESDGDAIRVGDTWLQRRLVGIVSIDTSALPDDAEILNATLKLTRGASYGEPFLALTSSSADVMQVDIKTGAFGNDPALQAGDFNAASTIPNAASTADSGTTPSIYLGTAAAGAINKTGLTQFRLSFADPTNGSPTGDRLGYYSAEGSTSANRPKLTVYYRVPD